MTKNTNDVIIIGGGIVGLCCAYELAKKQIGVTLLERGPCGREASWSGAGVLQSGNWHRKDELAQLLRESLRDYGEYTAELKERTGIDSQFVRCGSCDVLLTDQQYRMAKSEVEAARAHADFFGQTVLELLEPDQVRQRVPAITSELFGVKYNAITAQVQNPQTVRALKQACQTLGVHILEHQPARSLIRQGDKVIGVGTDLGDHFGSNVVISAGPWSSLIEPQLRPLLPVEPVRGQIVLLRMERRAFTHVVERGRCYLIPRLDGRIVLGATQEFDAGYEKANTAEGVNHLLTLSQQLVPPLASARIERTWAGLRPAAPDDWPIIGPVPGHQGLWAATAHYRSGLILAPKTGQLIADWITYGNTAYKTDNYAPGREFKKKKRKTNKSLLPTNQDPA